jgi:PHP family Zn ribbon phosphoesterase
VTLRADLHNHSCLSPCGDLEVSPTALCTVARERGISVLALTDHNSARNCPAFAEAAGRVGITPLFGTETTSREEVHILSLFPSVDEALSWGEWVYARLPDFHHDPEKFGDQVVVDVDENILDFEERYLVPAIDASIEEIHAETIARGGLIIPAHIDRSANSLLSQLGFLPDLTFSALEITRQPVQADTRGHTLICDSDAHFLEEIAQRSFRFPIDDAGNGDPGTLDSQTVFAALRAALAAGTTELVMPGSS